MTSLLEAPAAREITIKGLAYRVSEIDPGEEGTAAYRLDKVRGEGVYDVVRTHDGLVRCDCPSYVMTFEGTASPCKHGRALVEAGMLDAPSPVPTVVRPGVPEITAKDRARSRAFGISLPKVAPAVSVPTSPAKVETPVDHILGTQEMVEPPAGWDSIEADDEDTATTPADDHWMGETVALLLTASLIEAIEDGRGDEVDDLWFDLEEEHRESFRGFLAAIGSPATGFSSWMALCIAGSPVSFEPKPEPRPTWSPRFIPTPEQDMEWLGYELGNGGEDARAPEGRTFSELVHFYGGFLQGRADLEAEHHAWLASLEADRMDDMDDAFGGPEATWPAAELCEAGSRSGHPAYEG